MNANQMADILDTYTDTGMATSLANTNIKKVVTMLRQQQAEIEALYEVNADHDRLVRELDILLNNEGAAKQASLCDIVCQVRSNKWELRKAQEK